MLRAWSMAAALLFTTGAAGAAERVVHARIDGDVIEYTVHPDLTYETTQTIDRTLLTRRGLQGFDRDTLTFAPDQQSAEVVEAWVDHPDGSRVAVPPGSIFTRPSQAAQGAPGFLATVTTTVLFPQLREGSRTHIVWHSVRRVPQLLGLNFSYQGWYTWDARVQEMRFTLPAGVAFRWAQRGGVEVADTTEGDVRRVVARMPESEGQDEEPAMASTRDFLPLFLATSQTRPEDMGAIVYRASAGRAAVTTEIGALAARIAGERTGLEAARAIHAWVATNIRYIPVSLNAHSGYIPHPAGDVLASGSGDSRDMAVLMQALLAARGIAAVPALVDWAAHYAEPPLLTSYFFDHEILYLPDFDRWVNPPDRNAPFDALDRRLAGKTVVLVTPEGAVAHTPPVTAEANTYRYSAALRLDADGAIHGKAHYTLSPNVETGVRRALLGAMSMSSMAADTLSGTPEGGSGAFRSSDPRDLLHKLTLSARWNSPHAVSTVGREVFLSVPQGMDLAPPFQQRGKIAPPGPRRAPALAEAADLGWESTIALPPGLKVARLPPDVTLSTEAGRYTARYRMTDGGVQVVRRLVIAENVVPAEAYPALRTLLYAPLVDARAVIVLGRDGE